MTDKDYRELFKRLLESCNKHIRVGMYIEPDNYCIKIKDKNDNVIDWMSLTKEEYDALKEI